MRENNCIKLMLQYFNMYAHMHERCVDTGNIFSCQKALLLHAGRRYNCREIHCMRFSYQKQFRSNNIMLSLCNNITVKRKRNFKQLSAVAVRMLNGLYKSHTKFTKLLTQTKSSCKITINIKLCQQKENIKLLFQLLRRSFLAQ